VKARHWCWGVSTVCRKVTMDASCKGKVRREGHQWFCLDCGFTSSSWDTQHRPLQSRAAHFAECLLELVRVADAEENVGAAVAA
jgi:hypothetical protein